MVPPLTLCAYMKKGPNLRWSLIQCSGGDEGDRTPDLLTASQTLSQLSYAPVRKSTIRELPRRCKDNFGKIFGGASADAGRAQERGARGARPAGGGVAAGGFKTMPVYGAGPGTPERAVFGKIKTAGRRLAHSVKCKVWTAGPSPAP